MAFFSLKLGLDLEMRAAHPHKNSKEYPQGVSLQESSLNTSRPELTPLLLLPLLLVAETKRQCPLEKVPVLLKSY